MLIASRILRNLWTNLVACRGWVIKSAGFQLRCFWPTECWFGVVVAFVSLSRTQHNAVGLVCWVMAQCNYRKEIGFAPVFLVWLAAYCTTAPCKPLHGATDVEELVILQNRSSTIHCRKMLYVKAPWASLSDRFERYIKSHSVISIKSETKLETKSPSRVYRPCSDICQICLLTKKELNDAHNDDDYQSDHLGCSEDVLNSSRCLNADAVHKC